MMIAVVVPLACGGVSQEQRERSVREYELAVSLYRDERNLRGAIVALERALRLDPGNAEAHLLLGQFYGASELYDRAEPHLRRAVELFAAQVEDDPEKYARLSEARSALGEALTNLGRAAEAVPLLREVVRDVHYPSPHLALANLGHAYLALGQYRQAVQVLERAAGARANFCVAHYRLGEAFFRLNDDGRALTSLDRALSATEQGCDRIQQAWRLRGEVHVRLHRPDAARADFAHCRDMSPQTRDGRECASLLRTQEAP
jgi:tetratricopeptide (TPR) repeat protein